MTSVGAATILHADLDAFYASVEQLLDPSLRGQPVAVGSGVVLAASYEARAFGVRSGMPLRQARRLCPPLRSVPGHFDAYRRLGDEVIAVFEDFTPFVERLSIDEAFLDVAGARRLFGPPSDIGGAIRRRVRNEIGLPVSIGAARTRHLAKVASQVAKPDGLIVVDPAGEQTFVDPLPVELMWGVGPVTGARLKSAGIRTIGDLAATGSPLVQRLIGTAQGTTLSSLTASRDPRRPGTGRRPRSMGSQAALGRRVASPQLVRTTLAYLADRVAGRLRPARLAGRTVTVRVRFADLRSTTRALTVPVPVSSTPTLTEIAVGLAHSALVDDRGERHISLLAVSVSNLVPETAVQLQLRLGGLTPDPRQPGSAAGVARGALDRSVDAVRARFGREAVGYAAVACSAEDRVSEAFRELAERPPGRARADPDGPPASDGELRSPSEQGATCESSSVHPGAGGPGPD